MLALFRSIRKVAMTDAPVFISGESGTGKELTAVAIHQRSARPRPAVRRDQHGAILAASAASRELFGYERGAFTGANQRKIGRVEGRANGGTLFLDEIGDLPLESQASLLRFLQERKIERLGGRGSTPVDVRIISATHVDMQTAMIEGGFARTCITACACCRSTSRRSGRAARTSNCSRSTCSTASRWMRAGGCAAFRRARSRRSTTTAGRGTCAS